MEFRVVPYITQESTVHTNHRVHFYNANAAQEGSMPCLTGHSEVRTIERR